VFRDKIVLAIRNITLLAKFEKPKLELLFLGSKRWKIEQILHSSYTNRNRRKHNCRYSLKITLQKLSNP